MEKWKFLHLHRVTLNCRNLLGLPSTNVICSLRKEIWLMNNSRQNDHWLPVEPIYWINIWKKRKKFDDTTSWHSVCFTFNIYYIYIECVMCRYGMRYGYYGIVDITDMTLYCTGTLVLITEITVSSLSRYILQKSSANETLHSRVVLVFQKNNQNWNLGD